LGYRLNTHVITTETISAVQWMVQAVSLKTDSCSVSSANCKTATILQCKTTRHIIITDADTFSKAVEMVATDSLSVTLTSQADIDKRCSDLELEELRKSMSVMPGVLNTHCVQILH